MTRQAKEKEDAEKAAALARSRSGLGRIISRVNSAVDTARRVKLAGKRTLKGMRRTLSGAVLQVCGCVDGAAVLQIAAGVAAVASPR